MVRYIAKITEYFGQVYWYGYSSLAKPSFYPANTAKPVLFKTRKAAINKAKKGCFTGETPGVIKYTRVRG